VNIRAELDAQLRGLLKTFGLILGPGNTDALIRRAEALAEGHPVISGLVAKLAEVRRHVVAQIAGLDRDIRRLARTEPTLRRFMTVPGVGPITALAFLATIDDPTRFKHARDVGPYLGLTPTRYQSGETDRQGRTVGRDGQAGADLEMRGRLHPHLPLRGRPRAADQGAALLALEGVGHAPGEAGRR
jgi:transposase